MKTYTSAELAAVIEKHGKWLCDDDGGERATLSEANLSEANLSGANLRGADLNGANLSGANLRGADLRGADLSEANLSGANLRGADLIWADLNGANLSGANLSGANLRGADLIWADLSEANLSVANLRGADLSGADLSSADLSGAKNQIYIGQRSDGYQFFAKHDAEKSTWIISAGCRYFTPDKYRAHTQTYDRETKRTETLALIDFAEIQIKIRGIVDAREVENDNS